MNAPLAGIRVLEVASWLAAPSCAALMSDLGADVVKVEPPGGETYRRFMKTLVGDDVEHPSYQFDNRGKRGVCVDLDDPDARALVHELAGQSDVFITNLTRERLERYKLTDETIHELAPNAIYAVLSGFGTVGPDSHRQAFDQTAFWARSGAMSIFGDRDDGPVLPRGGYGDRTTALNLLCAILSAHPGSAIRPAKDSSWKSRCSAPASGRWQATSIQPSTSGYNLRKPAAKHRAIRSGTTIARTDDRWLALVMPAAMPYWPKFCRMVGRDEWISDSRFQDLLGLAEHGANLIPEIEAMFLAEDLETWRSRLDAAGLVWEPVALLPEVVEDPALVERGAFSLVVHPDAGAMEIVAAPFTIRDADVEVRGPAPNAGQHTRDVFIESGADPELVDRLLETGALR